MGCAALWLEDTLGIGKDMEKGALMISVRGDGHVLDRQRCCAGWACNSVAILTILLQGCEVCNDGRKELDGDCM